MGNQKMEENITRKYIFLKDQCKMLIRKKMGYDDDRLLAFLKGVKNFVKPDPNDDLYFAQNCLDLLSENTLLRTYLHKSSNPYVCCDKDENPVHEGDVILLKIQTDYPLDWEKGWNKEPKDTFGPVYTKWIKCRVEWIEKNIEWLLRPIDPDDVEELKREGNEYYEIDSDNIEVLKIQK
jgi:hypothetical protein